MNIETVLQIVTILVTIIMGVISKKSSFINNKLIPIQNLVIGVIMSVIYWIVTKDFSSAITLSGVMAGGTYDIVHNLKKILEKEE